LTVGIHDINVFWLVIEINVTDFEIHAFFKQYEAATVRKGAGRA
jgi:hypothetical protein